MSNIELPVGKHPLNGKKCLQRVVPLITTVAISTALLAVAAAPASAAGRSSAPISVSRNGRTAVALRADRGTTVIEIVPGTTLTISGTEVELDVSSQDVTDLENAAGLGSAIASLVGAILSVAQVPEGPAIAAIVATSLTVGSDVLKLCAGNDGGSIILSVSAPKGALPSVSACGVTV